MTRTEATARVIKAARHVIEIADAVPLRIYNATEVLREAITDYDSSTPNSEGGWRPSPHHVEAAAEAIYNCANVDLAIPPAVPWRGTSPALHKLYRTVAERALAAASIAPPAQEPTP